MSTPKWIPPLFWLAALYDGLLGLAFLAAPGRLFDLCQVTPPNHLGYVQFPAALLHARDVPDSTQVIAVSGAHHIDQRGKLILIDRNAGTQAGFGVKLLAPERDYPYREGMGTGGNVVHDTEGEQFQYPYPLDEDNYVVCYSPEGGPVRGLKGIRNGKAGSPAFGIYWMHRSGQRELLIYDPVISSGQQVPVTRSQPPFHRSTAVDEHRTHGRFYVQNIYFGPGLEGVRLGTVKRIRVVGLDYRAKGTVALGLHPWGGHQTSPCAINNGSYDVKHVLGTVDVEEDGSCYFECPSRVPVFFQILDDSGRMVQNMRSWTMVLPGEVFACIGCHEDKNSTFIDRHPVTLALKKTPQEIKPFFAEGDEPVQEMERFLSDSEKRAVQYLGTNAPQAMDVPRGFSYTREIQPIWDQPCIQCHAGGKNPAQKEAWQLGVVRVSLKRLLMEMLVEAATTAAGTAPAAEAPEAPLVTAEPVAASSPLATLAVRFDIDRLQSAAYGLAAWKVLWHAVQPEMLSSLSMVPPEKLRPRPPSSPGSRELVPGGGERRAGSDPQRPSRRADRRRQAQGQRDEREEEQKKIAEEGAHR